MGRGSPSGVALEGSRVRISTIDAAAMLTELLETITSRGASADVGKICDHCQIDSGRVSEVVALAIDRLVDTNVLCSTVGPAIHSR